MNGAEQEPTHGATEREEFAKRWALVPRAELLRMLGEFSWLLCEGARLHRCENGSDHKVLGYSVQLSGVLDFLRGSGVHKEADLEPLHHAQMEEINAMDGRKRGGLRKPGRYQGAFVNSDQGMIKAYVWAAVTLRRKIGDSVTSSFETVAKNLEGPLDALPGKVLPGKMEIARAAKVKSIFSKINSHNNHKDYPADGLEARFIEHFRLQVDLKNSEQLLQCYEDVVERAYRHLHRIS